MTIHPTSLQAAMLPRGRVTWPRIVLMAGSLLLAACTPHFEKPVLKVDRIEYRGGNILQQDFQVSFNIHNPNDRALPVSGLDAQLRVDGDAIASGATTQAFVVPALGDGQFDMSIRADMATGLLKLLGHHDVLNYELTGTVRIDLPFFRSLPFHQTGVLPLGGSSR